MAGHRAPGLAHDADAVVGAGIRLHVLPPTTPGGHLGVSAMVEDPGIRITEVQVRTWRLAPDAQGFTREATTFATDHEPAMSKALAIATPGTTGVRWVGVCYGPTRPADLGPAPVLGVTPRQACPGTAVQVDLDRLGPGAVASLHVHLVGRAVGIPTRSVVANGAGHAGVLLVAPPTPGSYALVAVTSPDGRWAAGLVEVARPGTTGCPPG